jgi:subtilisin-like proprotein convertase family protein
VEETGVPRENHLPAASHQQTLSYNVDQPGTERLINPEQRYFTFVFTVTASDVEGYDLFVLENVQLVVTITHPIRGDIQTVVICPSGTSSVVGAYRSLDRFA